MNLRQLQTLITIADAGGFAGAAGRLNLSQPAASRQIQALEAELGVLMFDRIGRRLQLTAEGQDIVRRGRRLLQEADSLRDRADALKGGSPGRCG
jgi:LysR family transcriptional regulator, cyn operon transcriptional activator